jgi:HAE1 family hydrophobic/amphiphilic exporter-1
LQTRLPAEESKDAAEKSADKKDGATAKEDKSKKSDKHGKGKHGKGGWNRGPRRPTYLTSRLGEREEIVVMSDQSVFISRSLDEVRWTAVLGGVFAIFVLYVFLRRIWFTGIVGLAIPLSVIATFSMMKLFGVSLNIMSLGGLALGVGMLVDNSIVVLESIFRAREAGHEPREAAVLGARSVASAVTASTLTTVAVFFPIVFVEGIAGQIFRDKSIVVVISLLVSLAVSTTFIPTLVSRQLQGATTPQGGWFDPAVAHFDGDYFRQHLSAFRSGRRAIWRVPVAVFSILAGIPGWFLERVGVYGWRLLRLIGEFVRRILTVVGGFSEIMSGRTFGIFDRSWSRLEAFYPRLLAAALRSRAIVMLISMMGGVGAGVLFSKIGSELIPEIHQGEFTVEVALPVGTRIERTDSIIRPLEAEIRQLPLVASLATTVGVEQDSSKAGEEGEHTARLLVRAKKDRAPTVVEEELKSAIRAILAREPEIASLHIRNPALFSFKTPIEVEIKGYNLDRLGQIARQVEASMRGIDSLKDVKLSLRPGYPEIHVKPRRDILIRHDLNLLEIGSTVRRKVKGDVATRFSEKDRKVDIRVRLREMDRSSLSDLRALVVSSTDDAKIPLEYVAEIFESEGPAEIRRIGQSRAALVTANLAGLDLGRATGAIADAVEDLDVPLDVSVAFGGQQTEMDLSRRSLIRALILAIFLVYVVMAAQFESLVQPFVILFSIPLAGIGIGPVLYYLEEPLSVSVFIGMIILAGIVVNNAIVLIDCINQLRRGGMPKLEAIARAGQLRLRPIFMTTVTTVLGLLPLTGALNHVPPVGPVFAAMLGVGEGSRFVRRWRSP